MRTTGLVLMVLVGLLMASSAAMAQVGTPGATPVSEPSAGEPVETTDGTPPADDTPAATVSEESVIPGKGIGIGTGWILPTDVTIPNSASVRFRLASGLTLEALVRLAWQGTTVDNTPDMGTTSTNKDATLEVELAGLVRKPMATRGKFQFVLVTGAGLGFTSQTDDPDGAMNSTTDTSITLFATWGFGIDWFFRSGWSFSLTALNPLFSLTRQHDDQLFNDQTITTIAIGAIFDPTIQALFHLYF